MARHNRDVPYVPCIYHDVFLFFILYFICISRYIYHIENVCLVLVLLSVVVPIDIIFDSADID